MSDNYILQNKDVAYTKIQEALQRRNNTWYQRNLMNKGRHLYLRDTRGSEHYYVIYKKDFFHKFNQYASTFLQDKPEYKGLGESINKDCLVFAMQNDATILYIYPDGNIYYVYPAAIYNLWKNASDTVKQELLRLQLKEGQYKIGNYTSDLEVVREMTYIFPVKIMCKFEL